MAGALSLSLRYWAIMVPSAGGTLSVLTPEREAGIQAALGIAFTALFLVAWVLRPESPPNRRSETQNRNPGESSGIWRSSTKSEQSDQSASR